MNALKKSEPFSTESRYDETKWKFSNSSNHLLLLDDDFVDNEDFKNIYESYENSRFDQSCDPRDEKLLSDDRVYNHRSVYAQMLQTRSF